MTTTDHAIERLRHAADELREVARVRLPWDDPPALYEATGALDEITRTIDAIVTQAGHGCDRLATSPDLRVDDMGPAADPAVLAYEAAHAFEAAGHGLYNAHGGIQAAHSGLSRLYLDPKDRA